MARVPIVEIAPRAPVATRTRTAAPVSRRSNVTATPAVDSQAAWCERQRKLADARAEFLSAKAQPAAAGTSTRPPPVTAASELAAVAPEASPDAVVASDLPPVDAEEWHGPWLPRPELFERPPVDRTQLVPLGLPVTLPSLDVADDDLARAVADALDEREPRARLLIERLVGHVDAGGLRALYARTVKLEAKGGVSLRFGKERRTSGGVFFSLAVARIGSRKFLQASVLAALTVGLTPRPTAT